MRPLLIAFWLGLSTVAIAGGAIQTVVAAKALVNAGAGADHSSANSADSAAYGKAIDTGLYSTGTLQCRWATLTGVAIDATVTLQSSSDGTNWQDKAGAVFTLAGASGNTLLSLSNITEPSYQVVYTHNSVTGGTINCLFTAKP